MWKRGSNVTWAMWLTTCSKTPPSVAMTRSPRACTAPALKTPKIQNHARNYACLCFLAPCCSCANSSVQQLYQGSQLVCLFFLETTLVWAEGWVQFPMIIECQCCSLRRMLFLSLLNYFGIVSYRPKYQCVRQMFSYLVCGFQCVRHILPCSMLLVCETPIISYCYSVLICETPAFLPSFWVFVHETPLLLPSFLVSVFKTTVILPCSLG